MFEVPAKAVRYLWRSSILVHAPTALVKRDAAPFASGGNSTVYRATLNNRPVVIKVLNVVPRTDQEKLHRVSSFGPKTSKRSLTPYPQLLVKEVVGWKWLRHENILPFVGVMFAPSPISIVSERMDNGNIMEFIKVNRNYNRLRFVSERRAMFLCHTDRLDSL